MEKPRPVPARAKSIRLPDDLWRKIKEYQTERGLSTELAAHRELLEYGLHAKSAETVREAHHAPIDG